MQIAFLLTCIIFLTFNSLLLKSFAYECPYNGAFLKARLRIKETTQNHLSQWAYYDNENEEWVIVPTINQDGYLTAETNVLATWTLLVPEVTTSAIVGTVAIASISALGILTLSVFYLKKRY